MCPESGHCPAVFCENWDSGPYDDTGYTTMWESESSLSKGWGVWLFNIRPPSPPETVSQ